MIHESNPNKCKEMGKSSEMKTNLHPPGCEERLFKMLAKHCMRLVSRHPHKFFKVHT